MDENGEYFDTTTRRESNANVNEVILERNLNVIDQNELPIKDFINEVNNYSNDIKTNAVIDNKRRKKLNKQYNELVLKSSRLKKYINNFTYNNTIREGIVVAYNNCDQKLKSLFNIVNNVSKGK